MHSLVHLSLILLFILASVSLPIFMSSFPLICSDYSCFLFPSFPPYIRIKGVGCVQEVPAPKGLLVWGEGTDIGIASYVRLQLAKGGT